MNVLNYFFEANLALIATSLLYIILLKNETSFSFMRGFLLTGTIASLLLPVIHFNFMLHNFFPSVSEVLPGILLQEVVIDRNKSTVISPLDFIQIMKWLYYLITFFFAVSLLYRIALLGRKIAASSITKHKDYLLIEGLDGEPGFSFFKYIFVGGKNQFTKEDRVKIISHEIAHVQMHHSADILFIELVRVFFWYNPAVYQLKRFMKEVHEYQADAATVDPHDTDSYCLLMASMALQAVHFPLANHFNQSQTLKRITMINTPKTKFPRSKLLLIILINFVLFLSIACQDQLKNGEKEHDIPNTELSSIDQVFTIIDQPAAPLDGIDEFYSNLASNLNYPESARRLGIEGKVYVEFTVNKDGSLSDIHILKGIHEECDLEARNALSLSQKWFPGKHQGKIVRQKMVLPITFKL
jgi:TonB family protein